MEKTGYTPSAMSDWHGDRQGVWSTYRHVKNHFGNRHAPCDGCPSEQGCKVRCAAYEHWVQTGKIVEPEAPECEWFSG